MKLSTIATLIAALALGCASRAKPDGSDNEVPQAYQDPVTLACNPAELSVDESDGDDPKPASPEAGLSPPQMVATSKTLIAHMDVLLERITAARQVARDRDDVVRLGCVNDRMLETKELLNVAESSHDYLVEAIQSDDAAGRDRYYNRITNAYQSIWLLNNEASECACQGLEQGQTAGR